MRRIDVIGIGLGAFGAGALLYGGLSLAGMDGPNAGIWSQAIFFGAVMGWVITYLARVGSRTMTYNQQLKDYEDAVLQKRLDEMTPEQIAELQSQVETESSETDTVSQSDPKA